MKIINVKLHTLACISFLVFHSSCNGQKDFGSAQLSLVKSIPLPGVAGRIDHIDVNLKDEVLYIAALGNNSLEAVDLKGGKILYSITQLDEPQGVAYIPQTNEVVVANGGNGHCNFYNANSFHETATLALGSDADDVRYDPSDKRVYVGYGDGGIAVIDAVKHQKIADIKLQAHPEGFQLDRQLKKLYVNVPDVGEIVLIDLTTHSVVGKWKTTYKANFPMAIDDIDHIVFVGYRHPGKLLAVSATTGKTISDIDLVGDTDDIFFDGHTNKIYASGGRGFLNVFAFDSSSLKKIANISVRNGARTSLLIPPLHLFVLAESAGSGEDAHLNVFSTAR